MEQLRTSYALRTPPGITIVSEASIFLGLIRYLLYETSGYVDWKFLEERTNAPYDFSGKKLADWKTNKNSMTKLET